MNSPSAAVRHRGCQLIVSPTARSGFAVGTEGARKGWLYDFFVNEPQVAPDLMALAVQLGAVRLVTYEHPLLEVFFAQFGFHTRVRVELAQLRDPPSEWSGDAARPDSELSSPDFLCMVRSEGEPMRAESMQSDGKDVMSRPGTEIQKENCGACGQALPELRWRAILKGYQCQQCGYLDVNGLLTLAPWDAPSKSPLTRLFNSGQKRSDANLFSSETDLLMQH